ncbi:MAG: hypothetical protein ACKV2V_19420 [Blastocatellia bacterium]
MNKSLLVVTGTLLIVVFVQPYGLVGPVTLTPCVQATVWQK